MLVACGDQQIQPAAVCGDGVVDNSEQCDHGAANGASGDGCTTSCGFACVDATSDCPVAPACQIASCTADHTCATTADAAQDGLTCGTDLVCLGGACISELCGNAVIDDGEACDFGIDNAAGSGCELDCSFSCVTGSSACDDGNACNGTEACGEVTVAGYLGQRCLPGMAADNGTTCGTDRICVNATCVDATCGDGYTATAEECDDQDQVTGNGCESDCTFSCLSTDPTRDCTPADACAGQGSCNDATHTCTAGTALANNTPCGTGGYCWVGVCTQPVCGNGQLEPGETCDNGMNNGTAGDGCKSDCTYACVTPATDCGTAPACQSWTCSVTHACQAVADATQDGDSCGSGMECNSGTCTALSAVCGNATVEAGEQCDFGTAGNGAGTGCETNCTFSCTTSPNSCNDGNACNGVETCGPVTVSGNTGRRCSAGTPPSAGTSCGLGSICLNQTCATSSCGDGFVNSATGETCEPPGTMTCDAACHVVAACGDGVRSAGEQCDDGNTINLDGCRSDCTFEQTQRFNALAVKFDTDSTCTKNALGGAAGSAAQSLINDAITMGVGSGSITVILHMLGLDNLAGTSEPALSVGVLGGLPVAGGSYNGASDLDWWYTTDATKIDANRNPTTILAAAIVASVLTVGPGDLSFEVQFVGVPIVMEMVSTVIKATIGASTTPTSSTGASPGHLASEHLDPTLTSFATMTGGTVCGETTARSLNNVQLASAILENCPNYSISNTLLDIYIGGCYAFFGLVKVVGVTQPDGARTGTDVYRFQADAQRRVNACTRNGVSAVLSECLANATYSSYYSFTSDRVIAK